MANETLYTNVDHLINPIWDTALWIMQERFAMPGLVKVFTDQRGMVDRKVSAYVDDSNSVQTALGETSDLSPVQLDRDLLATLTPEEIGKQYVISDRRVESDPVSIVADAGQALGYSLGKQVEKYMMGHFTDFSGGSYGSAANRASMDMLYWGRTKLEAEGVPGPYFTVLHPYQFRDIHTDFTSLSAAAPLSIRDQFQRSYYVTQVADFTIVVSNLVPTVKTTGATWAVSLGGATGGTFKLNINGQITAAIAYDALEAAIDTAIENLSNIAAGGVVVDTDAPPTGYDFTITAAGANISDDLKIHVYTDALTGFTSVPFVTKTSDGAGYFAGGMWNRDGLALDIRRGLRLEPERDASLRQTELNATMVFAHGVWRPNYGVKLASQATLSAPA